MSTDKLPADASVEELLAVVRGLSERVETLEAELAAVREEHRRQGVSDDVILAVSAAVAAFLGHRAKVKQVHYRTGQAYAQQGRVVVQGSHQNINSRAR